MIFEGKLSCDDDDNNVVQVKKDNYYVPGYMIDEEGLIVSWLYNVVDTGLREVEAPVEVTI